MKKHILLAGLFLLSALLTACGRGTGAVSQDTWIGMGPGADMTAIAERTEYYDLAVQSEYLFDLGLWEQNPQEKYIRSIIDMGGTVYLPLATQFWEGEPVQLWTEASNEILNVWLYRKDGSRELLLQNAPRLYSVYDYYASGYRWYMDQSGDFYCYCTTWPMINGELSPAETSIAKILSSGEILYDNMLEPGISIRDICQTTDGSIYLLLKSEKKDTLLLAELDPATGTLLPERQLELPFELYSPKYLGTADNFPVLMNYSYEDSNYRIIKINITDGSMVPVLFFAGTSYALPGGMDLQDLQVLADGSTELLMTDLNGLNCRFDQVQMQIVEKIPITVRGGCWVDAVFKEWVTQFNMENDTYHVIVEECIDRDELEDFARLTSVQMNSGNGPDILYGDDLMQDYIVGMLDKGALEDLYPYMEASGIREEDYFPLTFSTWRQGDHIYGIIPRVVISSSRLKIDGKLLGSSETPDIETLLDALLSREEGGVYVRGADSGQLLSFWLEGTETLWGMVDWENNTCDFNTPLFEKLLEAARRYGDDGRKNPESPIAENVDRNFVNVVWFDSSEKLKAAGKVIVGTLFDDGSYAAASSWQILAINSNSVHKEGAWEFIRFVISEEIQGLYDRLYTPVNRKAFEKWMPETIKDLTQIKYIAGIMAMPPYYGEEISEEAKAEYRQIIEEARPLPVRTVFIQEIILEEAEDYFKGYKNAEEVSVVVNNRVQLYLDENR